MTALIQEPVTYSVIGAFFEVYNTLGFGFLERVYRAALDQELRERGLAVAREVAIHVRYKGHDVGTQRIDMVIDQRVIVEIKSTYDLHPGASRQIYNYLRAARLEVGLLLHFGPDPRFHRFICSS